MCPYRKNCKADEKKTFGKWMIEFSKKVVVLCVLIHVAVYIYSAAAMWVSGDFTALPTIISESSEVLRACVFGYMVKAGIENWQKIKRSPGYTPGDDETEE